VDAQGETAGVQDVEHIEDVLGAAYETEHLGDVHGVTRPRIREQLAELRALKRVEATGGAGVLLEDDRVLDPGLVQDEVLTVGRLPVGRHPLVDQVGHAAPRCGDRFRPQLSANPVIIRHRIRLDSRRREAPKSPGSLDTRRACRKSNV
jgi:hypothetical protein